MVWCWGRVVGNVMRIVLPREQEEMEKLFPKVLAKITQYMFAYSDLSDGYRILKEIEVLAG